MTDPARIEAFAASDVRAQMLPMLWRERIPAATLSVIGGDPGLGKSTLTALIVAELSREGLPTIMSNVEDDLHGTTRPRLDVAGADLKRVHLIPAGFTLPRDLDALGNLIRSVHAVAAVLDPIASHFNPPSRVHDAHLLAQLRILARDTGCAIIGVHHLTKNGTFGGPNAGLRGGSRAAYVFGYDPEDRDRRALACDKSNGFEPPPTLLLEHETVEYRANGAIVEAGRVRLVGESDAQSHQVLRRGKHSPERDAAAAKWLSEFLAAGSDCSRQASEIRTAAKTAGFSWPAVRRACVRTRTERTRIGFGTDGFWVWRLADKHPLRVAQGVTVDGADAP